jgi:hypothetical protein
MNNVNHKLNLNLTDKEKKADTLNKLTSHVSEGTQPPTKEEIVAYLQSLREYYMEMRKQGKVHGQIKKDIAKGMYSSGLMYMNVTGLISSSASAAVYGASTTGMQVVTKFGSADPLIVPGILYTAQIGLNYRKLRKGKMTED